MPLGVVSPYTRTERGKLDKTHDTSLNSDGLIINKEDAIWTYTDKVVTPLRPSPEMFVIEDIAHALSNQCRFTGHTREFYSVAEHSYHASYLVPEEDALTALLHDASEAYLADLARPIKKAPGLGPVYLEYEEKLMEAISERFGTKHPLPDSVTRADTLMLCAEINDLLPTSFYASWEGVERAEVDLTKPFTPSVAEYAFLRRFADLTGTRLIAQREPGKVWHAKRTYAIA
jgi:5'-deoxynucleotidase YfbR-like HD superfamily hydrolase